MGTTRPAGHPYYRTSAHPRTPERADDDWRAESDRTGELLVFCPECWERDWWRSGGRSRAGDLAVGDEVASESRR